MVNQATQKQMTEWAENSGVLGGTTSVANGGSLIASGIEQVALTTDTQALNSNATLIQLTTTGAGVCTLPPAQNVGHVISIVRTDAVGGTIKITCVNAAGDTHSIGVAPVADQGNASTTNIVLTLADLAVAGTTLLWTGKGVGQGWMELANYGTTVATAGGAWASS